MFLLTSSLISHHYQTTCFIYDFSLLKFVKICFMAHYMVNFGKLFIVHKKDVCFVTRSCVFYVNKSDRLFIMFKSHMSLIFKNLSLTEWGMLTAFTIIEDLILFLFCSSCYIHFEPFSSVQLLSRVWLLVTPWTAARQASLSITNSWSPPKPMSIKLVMPSNHLILCRPLLLLPSIFPSIRVFSNESTLHVRWPKYWSFSFNISPSNEHQRFEPLLFCICIFRIAISFWWIDTWSFRKCPLCSHVSSPKVFCLYYYSYRLPW